MLLFERIDLIVNHYTPSRSKFAELINISQATFNGYFSKKTNKRIKITLLETILLKFPDVSREWLYFGEGKMLLADENENMPTSHYRSIIDNLKSENQSQFNEISELKNSLNYTQKEIEELKTRLIDAQAEIIGLSSELRGKKVNVMHVQTESNAHVIR